MKKILVLSIALIAVIALTAGGTWAYFNDVATSQGNKIVAGTLKFGSSDTITGNFTIDGVNHAGIKPGDNGQAGHYVITNAGTLSGDLHVKTDNFTSNALTGMLEVAIWFHPGATGTGTYNTSTDKYISSTGGVISGGVNGAIDGVPTAAFFVADDLTAISNAVLASGIGTGNIGTMYVEYNFPNTTTNSFFTDNPDNAAQGLSLTFNLVFALVQAGITSP